jgi:CRP/FNR family transcriptional regulator, cyclic AMP receptor protein
MHSCDAIGYLASGLVLAAFGMKDIVRLRIVAIGSNIVFLVYGLSLGLTPVWVLHAILLPLNGWRLAEVLGITERAARSLAGSAGRAAVG